MYSPVRQVSQSPHSYRHDDNIYTSRSRHEHVMQRIQTFHHQYTNLITNRWGHFANLYKHKPRIPMKKQEACLRRKPHEHQLLGDKLWLRICRVWSFLQYSTTKLTKPGNYIHNFYASKCYLCNVLMLTH